VALSGDVLGEAIAGAIVDSRANAEIKAQVEELWKKISKEIVGHFTENAVVTVAAGIAVSTSGSEFSQTGATTSTGSGTVA
jgi:hypothetical protein